MVKASLYLAEKTHGREAQKIQAAAHRVKCTIYVEAGQCALPAQLVLESDIAQKPDQVGIGGQDDVIETVPREAAVVVPGGESTQLLVTLEYRNRAPCAVQTRCQCEAGEPTADDGDFHVCNAHA